MNARHGIVKSFDSANYQATIQLAGSYKAYLEDVTVARNIGAGEMTAGRKVALLLFDENNVREALVVAVYF